MTVILPITEKGYRLAKRFEGAFDGARLFKPSRLKKGGLIKEVREAFKRRDGVVFVSAAGIAVRAIAPFIKGKHLDPPVVVTDEKGKFVVSLLSGHLGGANALAVKIAKTLCSTPVITTATDVNHLPCVEDVADRFSLAIDDVKKIKPVNSAILKGKKVCIIDANPSRLSAIKGAFKNSGSFAFRRKLPGKVRDYGAFVIISSLVERAAFPSRTLFLRPKEFVAGLGCDRGVRVKEVEMAYTAVLKEAGVSPFSVRNLASIDIKRDELGLSGFAKKSGLGIEFFTKEEIRKVTLPSGPSKLVMEKIGVGGVCEPCALLSAGVKKIWTRKKRLGRVTVALARRPGESFT